jgi:hypothetical protein
LVQIEENVWSAWRNAVGEDVEEPTLLLKFSPAGESTAAVHAVRESISEVWPTVQKEIDESEDPDRFAGEWRCLATPGGVLIQVAECNVFEQIIRGLVRGLERRGIDGIVGLPEQPTGVEAPSNADMLICRLRVSGHRRRFDLGYEWDPDPDAQAKIVAAAEHWCKQLGEQAGYALTKSTITRVPIGLGEDATAALLEGSSDNANAMLVAVSDREFRKIGAGPAGGLGLIVGGATIEEGGWRAALDELTRLLCENADLLVYSHVRRGWSGGLFSRPSQAHDWPSRPDAEPTAAGWTNQAFEDVFAPDAFALQLLGPAYAGRLTDTPHYRRDRVGDGHTLLEHTDPTAWFEAPFIPRGQHPGFGDLTPPPVLVEAREELAPILYTPGALNRAGYTDMPGL